MRSFRPVLLAVMVSGCAAPPRPPRVVALAPPAVDAVVLGVRPLAPLALRGDVLLALTGSPRLAAAAAGYDLVVETADGRTIACIDHGPAAARTGDAVVLLPGAGCAAAAGVAAGSAIQ